MGRLGFLRRREPVGQIENESPAGGISTSQATTAVVSLAIASFAGAAILEGWKLQTPYSVGVLSSATLIIVVGGAVLLMSGIQVVTALSKTAGAKASNPWPERSGLRRVAYMLLALTLYVFASNLVGFFFSSWVFVAVGMRILAAYRWLAVIGGGLVFAAVATVVFGVWLTMPLPIGPIGF